MLAAFVAPDAPTLLSRLPVETVIGIDIPIGLPTHDSRGAEREARALLGRRRSSVFPVPLRAALGARTLAQASVAQARVHHRGKRLSVQSFAILPKIREVDALVLSNREVLQRVVEVHPEVSFCCWNHESPLADSKKTRLGRQFRAALIEAAWPGALARLTDGLRSQHRGQWAVDDLHDAFAALWSARRYAWGVHRVLPSVPEWDASGLPMRIVV